MPLPNPYEPSCAGRVDSDLTDPLPTSPPPRPVHETYTSTTAYLPGPYPPGQVLGENPQLIAATVDPSTISVSFASMKTRAVKLGFRSLELGAPQAPSFQDFLRTEGEESIRLIMVSVRHNSPHRWSADDQIQDNRRLASLVPRLVSSSTTRFPS